MPDRFSFGPIELSASPGRQPSSAPPRPEPDTPFKILVLGNFSGPSGRTAGGPRKTFKPVPIDLDNQDEALARLDVRLELPLDAPGAPPAAIRIGSMDDFHPDQIVRQIPWFGQVHDLREQLKHPKTFASAAAQLENWIPMAPAGSQAAAPATAPAAPAPAQSESSDNMLERLLGRPGTGPAQPAQAPRVDISQLIRNAVQSSIVPGADPRQAELIAAVDAALGSRLNAILHHPQFQALEAAWRGLDLLVKTIELDETIGLYLVDASKEDLMEDFTASAGDLRAGWFCQGVVTPSVNQAGGQPWALWVGAHTFGLGAEDASLLAGLGKLAQAAGAPLLAALDPSALELWNQPNPPGQEQLKHWIALRRQPESAYLGLALPRVLLRLPYGKQTDAIEFFPFEEMPGRPEPAGYLWGNPAFACASLIGQSFNQSGWDLGENLLCELGGLPLHTYKEDGESAMTPCAEVWLNDQKSEVLLEQGLIPVQSILRRDAVRVPRLQSIRDPLAGLAARWMA